MSTELYLIIAIAVFLLYFIGSFVVICLINKNALDFEECAACFLISLMIGSGFPVMVPISILFGIAILVSEFGDAIVYDPNKKENQRKQEKEKLNREIEELLKIKEELKEYEDLGKKVLNKKKK